MTEVRIIWDRKRDDYIGTVRHHPELVLVASQFAWKVYWNRDGKPIPLNEDGYPTGGVHAQQIVQKEHMARYSRRTGDWRVTPLVYATHCASEWGKRLLQ